MDVENPLHVEIMPVAELVGIEVISEVLIEPKRETHTMNETTPTFIEKVWFWFEFGGVILIGLGVLAGFVIFLVWLTSPNIFGPVN
jgi:hypothetical protein